jgi:Glutaminase
MLPQSKRRELLTKTILATFSLLLFLLIACNNNHKQKEPGGTTGTGNDSTLLSDTSIVTVAALLPSADGKTMKVLFNEKEQIFTIAKEDKSFEGFNRSFEAALKSKTPVKIITDPHKGSFSMVTQPSASELEFFLSFRKEMLPGDSALRIDISKIDTAKFNIVDEYLKWPAFRLCTNVVPDYATAKQIFDYCAGQSCSIFGPHQVSPCIPFQYVIDGCYARAHKMRWIIEKHFGYCSEKVFSFANVGDHSLAVQANKWGGCCITWWFHVTPLIRVKMKFGKFIITRAYVIDPGMFDKPVLLSTWLQAQENIACYAHAKVDFYSIQPSSAYLPTYNTGPPFTTDPNYTQTNATLIGYANGHTCN